MTELFLILPIKAEDYLAGQISLVKFVKFHRVCTICRIHGNAGCN